MLRSENAIMLHGPANIARILLAVALATGLTAAPAMAIEEPSFQQLQQDGDFSVRRYAPVVVAETDVDGSLDHASSAGFRRLAGYIFGANHVNGGKSAQKIAMTAPVTLAAHTRIAMTAPVTSEQHPGGWTMNFTMPAGYTLATLPAPDDGRVRLREIPERTVAVIRFSGLVDDAKIAAKTRLLRAWMASHRLTATAQPELARYNPPWTLPFLRRNEIMIPCR